MKVILYMAVTANGLIARMNDKTGWSKEEWNNYYEKIKQVKSLIIGRRTYEIMRDHFEFKRIGNPFTVVVSSSALPTEENITVVKSPKDAINLLEEKGFSETIVGGGSKLNSSFIKDGLVNEIYLDIEPKIFGQGINLFYDADFELDLELVEVKKFSQNEIQLRYRIIK